jgi:hypothetical protein
MIDELYNVPKQDPDLQKVLSYLHQESTGIEYTDAVPTEIPFGKIVIYDDGAGTMRVYFRTGKNNIGYAALT